MFHLNTFPIPLIIGLLFGYLVCEMTVQKVSSELKITIFCLILLFTLGFAFTSLIVARRQVGPEFFIHDSALQIEEAIKYLLTEKNPYLENYFGTPLEKWEYGDQKPNPALYHLVYLPFVFIFCLPFYSLSNSLLGWFDVRVVYGLCFIGALVLLNKIIKNKDKKLKFLILFAFNPLFAADFVFGFNDIFIIFWLLLGVYLLKNNKLVLSGIPIGLACASKQSAWFFVPFYLFFVFRQVKRGKISQRLLKTIKNIWPLPIIFFVFVLPFLLWDTRAFFDDTYRYLNGSLPTSYPIKGLGLSAWLWSAGLIKSRFAYFPFWIFQLIFGLPVLAVLLNQQKKNNTLSQVIFNYAAFLGIFWFLSRFFNYNYLSFLSVLFLVGCLLEENDS